MTQIDQNHKILIDPSNTVDFYSVIWLRNRLSLSQKNNGKKSILSDVCTIVPQHLYLRDPILGLLENLTWRALGRLYSLILSSLEPCWSPCYSFICICHYVLLLPIEVLGRCYPGGCYGKLYWFKGRFLRFVTVGKFPTCSFANYYSYCYYSN